MNRSDSPAKQSKPFGINGPRETILPTTPSGDNTASYESGFPPITMTLKSAGGLPPKGQDMNQILFELSALGRWASSGAKNTYDSAFATAIGGYPAGSYVLGDDLKTVYRCTTDGNTANPNSVTTGWAKVANDISDILGLGTAATKDVGTGAGQIPDMSAFTSGTGWIRFPDGTTFQFGSAGMPTGINNVYVNFPRTFLNTNYRLSCTWNDVGVAQSGSAAQPPSNTGVSATSKSTTRFGLWQGGSGGFNVDWIAIGVS